MCHGSKNCVFRFFLRYLDFIAENSKKINALFGVRMQNINYILLILSEYLKIICNKFILEGNI
jgi:hypothetical protein